MGKETNFDPDILELAHNELQQLSNFIEHDPALKRLMTASSIQGDMANINDPNGGWSFLEQHINDIASYIGQITTDIQKESQFLQSRMRTSIDQLKGADDDNKSGLTKSRNRIDSGTGAQH